MSRAAFVREARGDLEALAEGLLALENGGSAKRVDDLFRRAHTLKGNCAAAGFDAPATVAHALEELLEAVRDGRLEPTGAALDAAFDAVDALEATLEEIAADGRPETDAEAAADRVRTALDDAAGAPTDPAGRDDGPSLEEIPEPGSGADLSPEEALERASVLDDLEAMSAGLDDEPATGADRVGTFDDLFDDEGDRADVGAGSADLEGAPPDGLEDGRDLEDEPDAPDADAVDFDRIRDGVEVADAREMDAALEGVEFGDASTDDDVSVADLVSMVDDDSDERSPANADDERSPADTDDERSPADAGADPGSADSAGVDSPETGAADDGSSTADDGSSTVDDGPSTADRARRAMDAAGVDDRQLIENIRRLEPADDPADEATFLFDHDGIDEGADDVIDEDVRDVIDEDIRDVIDEDVHDVVDEETDDAVDEGADDDSGDGGEGTDVDGPGPADDGVADADPAADDPSPTPVADVDDASGPAPDLEGFDRDSGLEAFVSTFGDSFDEPAAGRSALPEATATTIPSSIVGGSDEGDGDAGGDAASEPITVAGETADRLLRLVEGLTTVTTALERARAAGDDARVDEATLDLRAIGTDLEAAVTDVRLQPLERAFTGLARAARRAARAADRRVEFVTEGETIELDRDVVGALGDPLVHLVRNAVDHGIEPPAERSAAGKPETGTVTVRARKDGDEAVLEVADDGRGMDPDDLRRTAVEDGRLTEAEARELDDEAALALAFRPGLSTRSEVTDVSGRGVGMDAVDDVVTRLEGDVTVESELGVGTTVRLRVPVSVAATEVLFVVVGDERYAIPAADVARVEAFDPRRVDGGAYEVTVEGEDGPETDRRPLVVLADRLGADGGGEPTVVVHVREARGGLTLACDDVGDWRRVVIRPYDDLLATVPGVEGATLLGNGELANVLDVGTIDDVAVAVDGDDGDLEAGPGVSA